MARQRGFDEDDVVAAAVRLFTDRGYEGTSVDDLVSGLGVHRGSLYRTFGSKLELFHRALRAHVDRDLLPWLASLATTADPVAGALAATRPDVGLLLVAAVERAPSDPVAAAEVTRVVDALTTTVGRSGEGRADVVAAGVLGLWLRSRAGAPQAAVRRVAGALSAAIPT